MAWNEIIMQKIVARFMEFRAMLSTNNEHSKDKDLFLFQILDQSNF